MSNFDPGAVAVRPAATVMLVDDVPALKVFMMKRNANTAFAGGMWVFPGGAVDDADDGKDFSDICTGLSPGAANRMLGVRAKGLAYFVAAAREAFEEAGILFAINRDSGESLALTDPSVRERFNDYRDGVNNGTTDFADVLKAENLALDVGQFHYVARWITPPGPPRRFDTRFFIATMPSYQKPIHDESELVHSEWLPPAEVVLRARSRDMGMLPPTLRMIERLSEFDSAKQVIAAAAVGQPEERVPMGGADAQEGMSKAEPGWVRLKATR